MEIIKIKSNKKNLAFQYEEIFKKIDEKSYFVIVNY